MKRDEVDLAIEWAAEEGWNPGIDDASSFYSADPHGFFIGLLGDEPIATLSAVKYDDSFGFLGFYIVKPEYRKNGYGVELWNTTLKYLEGCNIGLDGVVAQQDNYKKSGFQLAYRNIRYEGHGDGDVPSNPLVVKLSTLPFETIDSYDRIFFPANRTPFLKSWLSQANGNALGIVRNGKLTGYGVIRKCRQGYKIGPLFADNPEWAELLFLSLKSRVAPAEPFYLDTPEPNKTAIALAERYKMHPVFETARMYRGEEPSTPLNRLYGVTSFELG